MDFVPLIIDSIADQAITTKSGPQVILEPYQVKNHGSLLYPSSQCSQSPERFTMALIKRFSSLGIFLVFS